VVVVVVIATTMVVVVVMVKSHEMDGEGDEGVHGEGHDEVKGGTKLKKFN